MGGKFFKFLARPVSDPTLITGLRALKTKDPNELKTGLTLSMYGLNNIAMKFLPKTPLPSSRKVLTDIGRRAIGL